MDEEYPEIDETKPDRYFKVTLKIEALRHETAEDIKKLFIKKFKVRGGWRILDVEELPYVS